ncbi:MAG TPA: universal stress protein [Pyrinomonadaceae bacterium]
MKIMIAYDGSVYADAALDDLRKAGLPRDAEALIVSVSDGLVSASAPIAEIAGSAHASRRVTSVIEVARDQAVQLVEEARRFAGLARGRLVSYFPEWEVRTQVLEGSPSSELLRKAELWQPDLIIVGSQGRSALGRFFLGSVSKALATQSSSSVRVARHTADREQDLPPRLIIGVDGSTEALAAVRAVGCRVWPEGTQIKIITVDESMSSGNTLQIALPSGTITVNNEATGKALQMAEWAADQFRAIGLNVSVMMAKGKAQNILLDEAIKWEADSIFVGAHGLDHRDERSGLGAVSDSLIANASCSVEVGR